MDFCDRLENLWSNPNQVNISECFLYLIAITDDHNQEYRYVGKARNASRLKEYKNNMLKIKAGKERGKAQGYRTVHFALYSALECGWRITFHPLENCAQEKLNEFENKKITELQCNLNGGRTWRVSNITNLTLAGLVR